MKSKEFDSKNNDETKKYLLGSGIPCKIHGCVKCCIDTRMPLTRLDIARISGQGYKSKDFVVKRKRERQLKNRNGRCVFLGDNGCTIYSFRPEGCRLYPLVYNEDDGKGFIHDFCPYGHDFKVSIEDIDMLNVLIKKLDNNE
ncbi:YkgJ family cysteine cluster protein [Candidatus Bathyarchaeota archaeon]|nr:YkgJ family cysteine cluster protein [Candidatus Bathyarchaeota archaeon]